MSHKPIVHPAANNELLSGSTSKHVTRSEPTFHLLQNEGKNTVQVIATED